MEIEMFFGFGDLIEYKFGDHIQWIPHKAPQNGGRPQNGNLDGEGYVVCPYCGKDFFTKVKVKADVITRVCPDDKKKPFIS